MHEASSITIRSLTGSDARRHLDDVAALRIAVFDHREAHARRLGGFGWTAFAAVERGPQDPRRPEGHRGHEVLWTARGYTRRPELGMQLDWAEAGVGECSHALRFWLRPLEQAA
ncbi:hypothetical protein [Luteimonas sp. A482]